MVSAIDGIFNFNVSELQSMIVISSRFEAWGPHRERTMAVSTAAILATTEERATLVVVPVRVTSVTIWTALFIQ